MKNLLSAQTLIKSATAQLAKVKKQAHNEQVHALAKASEKECTRFSNRKTELNADDMKSFSKSLTQLRYRTELLTKGDSALKWMHEQGIKNDVTARNTYGKALYLVDKILGNAPMNYEQSSYAERMWNEVITVEKPTEQGIKVTARKLAYACGKGENPLGQTQPYALLKALEILQCGTRKMAGRGDNWMNSTFYIDVNSALYQAVTGKSKSAKAQTAKA